MLATALQGVVLERVAFRPLRGAPFPFSFRTTGGLDQETGTFAWQSRGTGKLRKNPRRAGVNPALTFFFGNIRNQWLSVSAALRPG